MPKFSESAESLLKEGTQKIGLFESRLLLQFLTKKSSAEILGFADSIFLTPKQKAFWDSALVRRQKGEPFFYIVGEVAFGELVFKVTPDVLIPRPETEELLTASCAFLTQKPQAKVLDLGTGSGILAVCLKKRFPQCQVWASDISFAALKIAQENAQKNAQNIQFLKSHWFAQIFDSFDLIVSNPPYIAQDDPHLKALVFEPQNALVAKNHGTADLLEIINSAPKHLNSGGALFLEHGHHQAAICQKALKKNGFCDVFTRYDLSQMPRVSGGFLR